VLPTFAKEKDVETTWGEAEEEGEKGGCLTAPRKTEKGRGGALMHHEKSKRGKVTRLG